MDLSIRIFSEEINPNIRYAIVKPRPYNVGGDGRPTTPVTIPLQDWPKPDSTGKGEQIFIRSNVWRYIEKINSPRVYDYLRVPSLFWINNTDGDFESKYGTLKAESLMCSYNYISFDDETSSHVRLVSYPNNFDFINKLNPYVNNWFSHPYRFWKAAAINSQGKIFKVGNGYDVYIPILYRTEKVSPTFTPTAVWMPKKDLEFFPQFDPTGRRINYRWWGVNVYDGFEPLMTTDKNRVRRYYKSWFHPNTYNVIVPDGWL